MPEENSQEKKISNISDRQKARIKEKLLLTEILDEISEIEKPVEKTVVEFLGEIGLFERAASLPSIFHLDIAKKICDVFGLHPAEAKAFREHLTLLAVENGNTDALKKKIKVPAATREDYYQLYQNVLGDLRRDIFSGNLMCLDQSGFWVPAVNKKRLLRSDAANLSESIKFNLDLIQDHLESLCRNKEPELILDLPEWDREDRISAVARAMFLDQSQAGFDHKLIEQYVKAWLVGVFKKIEDPHHQNWILIFKGPQGIGKDYLIEQLVGGFGQFAPNMTIHRNEVDNLLQLSRAAVLRIAEFDRTARTEISTLKDMITRSSSVVRAAYAEEAQHRHCRASFIASCNVDDIYRDETGHRRFAVLNLSSIAKGQYPSGPENQAQVLAQARKLYESGYQIPKRACDLMGQFLETVRPTSSEEEAVEAYEDHLRQWLEQGVNFIAAREIIQRGWITNSELRGSGVLAKAAKELGVSEKFFRQKLKVSGLEKRTTGCRGFLVTQGSVIVTANDESPVIENF